MTHNFFRIILLLVIPFYSCSQDTTELSQLKKEIEEVSLKDFDKSIELARKGFKMVENTNFEEYKADFLEGIARGLQKKTIFDSSLVYHLRAIQIYEKLGKKRKHGFVLNEMARINRKLMNNDEAIEIYDQALEIFEEIKDLEGIATILNESGIVYSDKEEYTEAEKRFKKSLTIQEERKDSIGIGYSFEFIGYNYFAQKEFVKAEKYFFKALEVRQKIKDTFALAINHSYISELFYAKNDFQNALKYAKRSSELALSINYTDLFLYNLNLQVRNLQKLNQFEEAFFLLQKEHSLRDSLYNIEKVKNTDRLTKKFQTAEKDKKIALQQVKMERRTRWVFGLVFGLVALMVVSYLIYRQQITKRKSLEKENQLKDVIHQQKLQNKLYEERLRISRDLHDNIGSQLTFISSSIDNVQYENKDEKVNSELSNIVDFTKSTSSQLRDTIWAMNKSGITPKELEARIFNYVKQSDSLQQKTSISFKNEWKNQNFTLTSIQGMNCYRIIQEAINNSIKYALAKTINVIFQETKDELIVAIKDDGIGFKMTNIQLGNGLKNMEFRAKEIEGKLKINSSKDDGTHVQLTIPKNTLNDV